MGIRVTNIGADNFCGYSYDGPYNIKFLHVECTGTVETGSDDASGGFYFGGGGVTGFEFGYNYIHGPTPTGGGSATCDTFSNTQHMWCASGIKVFAGGTDYVSNLAHHNLVANLFNDGIDFGGHASMYNNDVSGIQRSGHSDSIQCQNGSYCAIYNNYIHRSGAQNIYLDAIGGTCAHVRIYNNVIYSPTGHGGINPDPEASPWDDIVIANNTFYASKTYNIYYSGRETLTNVAIFNNIFGGGTDTSYHMVEQMSATQLTPTVWIMIYIPRWEPTILL